MKKSQVSKPPQMHDDDILHSLNPYVTFGLNVHIWTAIFGTIPKIVFLFGDTEFNFMSLGQMIGCTPETACKLRLVAQMNHKKPFQHLLYAFYESSPKPEHFIQTIFEWAQVIGKLKEWINFIITDTEFPRIYMTFVDVYTRYTN